MTSFPLRILPKLCLCFLSCALTWSRPAQAWFWGVGNSAFQVEGSPLESDWTRWTRIPGKIKDGTNADRATDFWNRYEQDFDDAARLGVNSFRISLAWERIEPRPGVWDDAALAHYEAMIVAIRKRGLEPFVTIQHFVLPAWLADQGGLESPEFPALFARFAARVVDRLGRPPASVRWWMTFNESMGQVAAAYLSPLWPPGVFDANRAAEAAANSARAHVRAVLALRALGLPDLQIGIAHAWRPFRAATQLSPVDQGLAVTAEEVYNGQYLRAVTTGKIRMWMTGTKVVRDRIRVPPGTKLLDFIGINYYGRKLIRFTPRTPFVELIEGPGPKTDMGWEIYPQGLRRVLKDAAKYQLPLLISENGLADEHDAQRTEFIRAHLSELRRAQNGGADLLGYMHWSLTDNFEWAEGLSARFGLIDIDYETLTRRERPSFFDFRDLIRAY